MYKVLILALAVAAINAQNQQAPTKEQLVQDAAKSLTGTTFAPLALKDVVAKIPSNITTPDQMKAYAESFFKSAGASRDVTKAPSTNGTSSTGNTTKPEGSFNQTSKNQTGEQPKNSTLGGGEPPKNSTATKEQPKQNGTTSESGKKNKFGPPRAGTENWGKFTGDLDDRDDVEAFMNATKGGDLWMSNGCTCICLVQSDGKDIKSNDTGSQVKVPAQQCSNKNRKLSRNFGRSCYCQCCGAAKYKGVNHLSVVEEKVEEKKKQN